MSGMLIKKIFFFFFSNQPKIDPPDPRNKKLTWYGLISMQLPQMSIVSIQLAMGSVGFLTCLILAARTVALTTVKA